MSNASPQKLIQDLKDGKIQLESLLNPAKHISDFDPEQLRINTIPCGFASLDEYMLLKEGRSELIFIGGRPSMGKSAFMFQLAYNVAHNMPVHVFSLEMDADQIRARLLAGKMNRSLTRILKGLEDPRAMAKAHQELGALNYFIDDRAGLNVFKLCDAARELHAKIGTKLIVIDYLQLLRTPRGHSKDDEIGTITKELKALAKELRVPIVVGSQLNRACEARGTENGDFRPILSDLRESGNIEQDADMVLFVHRQSRYTGERPGEADIIVAKNRNGAVGDIRMQFTEIQTRFIDMGVII